MSIAHLDIPDVSSERCIGTIAAAGSATPVWTLALRFAFSLVPIAFVYNVTHYYTLLISQGANIVRLASDPFGLGWDLFGTAQWLSTPIILDAGGVWHTQVGLIERGQRNASLDVAYRVARALGLPLSTLIAEAERHRR